VSCSAQSAQGGHFNQKIHGSGFLHMLSWKFIFGNTFDVIKDRAAQARHFKPVGFEFGPTRENLWIFKNVMVQNVWLPLTPAARVGHHWWWIAAGVVKKLPGQFLGKWPGTTQIQCGARCWAFLVLTWEFAWPGRIHFWLRRSGAGQQQLAS